MGEGIANVAMFNRFVPGSPECFWNEQIREQMCLSIPGASMQIETKHPCIFDRIAARIHETGDPQTFISFISLASVLASTSQLIHFQ